MRELGSVPSDPGKNVVLTLDHELQVFAQNQLADQRRASMVALDVATGSVLVMVSAAGQIKKRAAGPINRCQRPQKTYC